MHAQVNTSIVIPCYASGQWLPSLVERIVEVMRKRDEPFEVVLVNDASPDKTWEAIEKCAKQYEEVEGVDLLFNAGQFTATLVGLLAAGGELIVTMDDDLQHAPEDIPKLLSLLEKDFKVDCVLASFPAKQHSWIRNLGTTVMGRLFELHYGKPRHVQATSFRALRRKLAEAICEHGAVNVHLNAWIFQSTNRIATVEVEHHPRPEGESGYSLPRLGRILLDNVLSVSTLPLRIVSLMGLASAGVSFLLGVFYLVRYFMGYINAPGFATLVLLTNFFGGMILFSVGLLGEYIIRIMDEVKRRPRFVVRQQTDAARSEESSSES